MDFSRKRLLLSPSTVASKSKSSSSRVETTSSAACVPQKQRWGCYYGVLGHLRLAMRGVLRLWGSVWMWTRLRYPLLCTLIYVYCHLLVFSLTLRLVSVFLFPLLFDWAGYWWFWIRSILHSYRGFVRTWKESSANQVYIAKSRVFHHQSPIVDRFITYFYRFVNGNYHGTTLRLFRQYLSSVPPAFPLTSHDYFWLQDTRENSCQVIGLALVERMTLSRLQRVVKERWIDSEPKLTARFTSRYGRYCWDALVSADCPFTLTDDQTRFNLNDHVYEVSIDLSQTTIYEALSGLASETLSPTKPRWRIVLLNPVANLNPTTGERSDDFSCMALQIHHGIGDGIAIAHAVVQKLFDSQDRTEWPLRPPNAKHLTTSSTPLIDTGRAALYYFWNAIKCAALGIRVLGFWLLWCPKPPAIFQCDKTLAARRPAGGTKFLGPPVVLDMAEMNKLRETIKSVAGIAPTVNDVLAYCLTIAIDRLRSGTATAELRAKMARRKATKLEIDDDYFSTPMCNSNRLSVQHVYEGVPLVSADLDMSTPTTLTSHRPLIKRRRKSIDTEEWNKCLKEFINFSDHSYHPNASNFEDYLQLMIPMATRTSAPTTLDNFTGPVLVRLPLLSYTRRVYSQKLQEWSKRLSGVLGSSAKPVLTALRHLRVVKNEIDEMKQNDYGPVFFTLICLCCKVFPDILSRKVVTAVNDRMQLLLTNVIGSADPMCWMDGLKVSSLQFWPPAKGEVTGGVAVLSFGDRLQIFSIFDENEFLDVFHSAEDYQLLTKHDRTAMSQFVGNLIKAEFIRLVQITSLLPQT